MNLDQHAVDKIRAAFPDAIEEIIDHRGERTLVIQSPQIVKVCELLKDDSELRYDFLMDVVADDMLPDSPRFAVNYHLYSIPNNHQLRLRVQVEDPEKGPDTVAPVWSIATWLETEVWDLMGIRFKDNKGLRRLFMPEDWQGHPLRKDYPLGYEEVQFSFSLDEIGEKKPFAEE